MGYLKVYFFFPNVARIFPITILLLSCMIMPWPENIPKIYINDQFTYKNTYFALKGCNVLDMSIRAKEKAREGTEIPHPPFDPHKNKLSLFFLLLSG